jgi:hypothetical protein
MRDAVSMSPSNSIMLSTFFPIKYVVNSVCTQFPFPFDTHEARAPRIGRSQARYLDIQKELVDGWEPNVS